MGQRGPKQRFTEVLCPNKDCSLYGVPGSGNIVANGTYRTRSGIVRKFRCKSCGRVFNERTGSVYAHTHITKEQHDLIVACRANGISVRRTADIAGCTPKTVVKRTKNDADRKA